MLSIVPYKSIFLTIVCLGASAAEAMLAVGEKVSSTVSFYTTGGKKLATIKVGQHPHEMALSRDGRQLYVSDNGVLWMTDAGQGGNSVTIIDVAKREKAGVIDLGKYRRPHGIAVDGKSGRLVVTTELPHGLLMLDPGSRKVVRNYDTKGTGPHMVTVDGAAEWAYASNTNTNTLAAVNLKTAEVRLIPVGRRPQGSVFSHDGKTLYLTNSESGSISIVDAAAGKVTATIGTGKGPGRVALTPDQSALVYNLQTGNAVGFADLKTRKQVTEIALPGPPMSLTLSPDGKRAYAGIQSLDQIAVIDVANRKLARMLTLPKGSGPDAVLEVAAP